MILFRFVWFTLLFSVPLWLLASLFDSTKIIPIKLPISALQFLSVLLAAMIVTHQNGNSVYELLQRGFDFARITSPFWQIAIFILMPLTIILSYSLMAWSGINLPDKMTPVLSIPIFLLVYAISGYCEQIGWTAIMTDELFELKFSVLAVGFIVGATWAAWHIIPFMQTHNTATWIFWQCMYTIIYRILLTKVYILTDRSVFSTIAMHATYNTAFSIMPYYGSSYDPMYMTLATSLLTISIVLIL